MRSNPATIRHDIDLENSRTRSKLYPANLDHRTILPEYVVQLTRHSPCSVPFVTARSPSAIDLVVDLRQHSANEYDDIRSDKSQTNDVRKRSTES